MSHTKNIDKIKRLIWIYFFLIVFEGAIRKWIFPGFQRPLLIVRDPVVIWIYILALSGRVFPRGKFISSIILLANASFIVSLFVPEGNVLVNLFGLRANFLHLPLIFLMPKVFTAEDVRKIGKWFFICSVLVMLIMVMQFATERTSVWNRGVSGEYDQNPSALGKGRPPGTFSFSTGPTLFFSLVCAFLIYGVSHKKAYNKVLLLISGMSLLAAMAVSGSRGFIVSVALVFLTLVCIIIVKPFLSGRLLKFSAFILVILAIASSLTVYKSGGNVLKARFAVGGGIKKGIINRTVSTFGAAAEMCSVCPFLGYGLGAGTNVGSVLLTEKMGKVTIENEWCRNIAEGGLLFGPLYILLRFSIVVYMFIKSYKSLHLSNILPMLIFGASFPNILMGQFGQANILGFAVFGAGLCLAATNIPSKDSAEIAAS
jgi:hypothetical protein